jgi:hypothetical protein
MRSRTTVLRLALLLMACFVVPAGSSAARADAPRPAPKKASTDPAVLTFGVQAASRTKPDSRPHFDYTAVQNGAVVDYLAVSNYSARQLALHLYPADAYTNTDGGFDLRSSTLTSTDIGRWIKLPNSRITLAPRTRAILPFRLVVPAQASPGDHTGGIVASLTTTSRDAKGDVVTVEHRLAERIYLRVPGALRPSLDVEDLAAGYAGRRNPLGRGSAHLRYRVINTGNIRLGAAVSAKVHNLLGSRPAGSRTRVAEILPGSSVILEGTAQHVVPLLRASARVTVDPVLLTPKDSAAVERTEAGKGLWTVPWSFLIGAGLVALGVRVVRRRAATRARNRGRHSAPGRTSVLAGLRSSS